jgi:hypothetical protein
MNSLPEKAMRADMGSGEEWANGHGCFRLTLAPAALALLMLHLIRRGRQR